MSLLLDAMIIDIVVALDEVASNYLMSLIKTGKCTNGTVSLFLKHTYIHINTHTYTHTRK